MRSVVCYSKYGSRSCHWCCMMLALQRPLRYCCSSTTSAYGQDHTSSYNTVTCVYQPECMSTVCPPDIRVCSHPSLACSIEGDPRNLKALAVACRAQSLRNMSFDYCLLITHALGQYALDRPVSINKAMDGVRKHRRRKRDVRRVVLLGKAFVH